MISNLVDLFQTLAIIGLFVLLIFTNRNIIKNAGSIERLAGVVSDWLKEKSR